VARASGSGQAAVAAAATSLQRCPCSSTTVQLKPYRAGRLTLAERHRRGTSLMVDGPGVSSTIDAGGSTACGHTVLPLRRHPIALCIVLPCAYLFWPRGLERVPTAPASALRYDVESGLRWCPTRLLVLACALVLCSDQYCMCCVLSVTASCTPAPKWIHCSSRNTLFFSNTQLPDVLISLCWLLCCIDRHRGCDAITV
jgi:hypothetical protein